MNSEIKFALSALTMMLCFLIGGCASGPPKMPFPAFVVVDELSNVFIAGLPGVRAKQLAGDPRTRRTSNRVRIPSSWEFTTGASPTQNMEIFVLAGEVQLGEFTLGAGGYAYLPSGSSGFEIRTQNGASILYFLDEPDEREVIQTPLIVSSDLLDWERTTTGFAEKELRADPGSGARTWLVQVEPGASEGWQRASQTVEGYLLSGSMTQGECLEEEAVSAEYLPGGYFYRPAEAIHGGPAFATSTGATWFLRVHDQTTIDFVSGCVVTAN